MQSQGTEEIINTKAKPPTVPSTAKQQPRRSAMNRGAIAMIDALGFKGIWGEAAAPSLDALQSLKLARKAVVDASKDWEALLESGRLPAGFGNLVRQASVSVLLLSDTLVISASTAQRLRRPPTRHEKKARSDTGMNLEQRQLALDGFLRFVVCWCVCHGLRAASLAPQPLVFRGVVTVGQFLIDDTILIGPAVDEAAELMQMADGALVWLAPSAQRLAHLLVQSPDPWSSMAIPHRVPFRDGRRIKTRVLNPYAFCDPSERKEVRKGIAASMDSNRPEIVIKRQNTFEFLSRADYRMRVKERQSQEAPPPAKA